MSEWNKIVTGMEPDVDDIQDDEERKLEEAALIRLEEEWIR